MIDEKTVTKVAKLSRIKVEEGEKAHYAKEMNTILNWMEQLQEVNTDGVPELTSVANIKLPLREDAVTDGEKTSQILSNAPKAEFDCFVVPKVVDAG